MEHVASEREISLSEDQWKLYQCKEIPEGWYIDEKTGKLKRIDHYWDKIFFIQTENGEKKYDLLEVVVKSCLSIHHGNVVYLVTKIL